MIKIIIGLAVLLLIWIIYDVETFREPLFFQSRYDLGKKILTSVSKKTPTPKCQKGKYLTLPKFSPAPANGSKAIEYDENLAKYLMAVSFNIEISNCSNLGPLPNLPDFELKIPIVGTSFIGIKRTFAYLFSSIKYKTTILAFSGTMFDDEWLKDFEFAQVSCPKLASYKNGVLCHEGFYDIYTSMQSKITLELPKIRQKNFYITGHSLGGGLATMAAFDLYKFNPIVYSFASPRVFNPLGSLIYNQNVTASHRIYNTEDIATTIPLPIDDITDQGTVYYEHVSNATGFTHNMESVANNHTLAYLEKYLLA